MSKNNRQMRKIILIVLFAVAATGTGVVVLSSTMKKAATPEQESIRDYIRVYYPEAKTGEVRQYPATASHAVGLYLAADEHIELETLEAHNARPDSIWGQMVEVDMTYAGDAGTLFAYYEDGVKKLHLLARK
jgi:flagellar basal body-associated protein FliL